MQQPHGLGSADLVLPFSELLFYNMKFMLTVPSLYMQPLPSNIDHLKCKKSKLLTQDCIKLQTQGRTPALHTILEECLHRTIAPF